jgi:hypothetical protein
MMAFYFIVLLRDSMPDVMRNKHSSVLFIFIVFDVLSWRKKSTVLNLCLQILFTFFYGLSFKLDQFFFFYCKDSLLLVPVNFTRCNITWSEPQRQIGYLSELFFYYWSMKGEEVETFLNFIECTEKTLIFLMVISSCKSLIDSFRSSHFSGRRPPHKTICKATLRAAHLWICHL